MRARVLPIILAATAALLLAGCAGSASDGTEAYSGTTVDGGAMEDGAMNEGAMTSEVAPDAMAGAPIDKASPEQQVIKTGYVTMLVDDVARSTADIHAMILRRGGQVAAEDVRTSGESTYATITAQVPADALDAFIAEISALGTVDSITITAQDVTTQVVDLDARISALQASIDRMTELLAEAQRIEDLLAIETQLSMRQAELDSLVAQRAWLGDQVAMSTVTVSLSPRTELAGVDAPGFLSGLQSGWAALVSFVMLAITALGFVLPYFAVIALIAIPIIVVVVLRARRRARKQTTVALEHVDQETSA